MTKSKRKKKIEKKCESCLAVRSNAIFHYYCSLFTREIGLEVSADKTKYVVMSRDQNAGRNHNVRIDNRTFERVEEFKYLGTTLTNQIKSRLRSGNACYHSVQNLLSSRLLSKNLKIKIYIEL